MITNCIDLAVFVYCTSGRGGLLSELKSPIFIDPISGENISFSKVSYPFGSVVCKAFEIYSKIFDERFLILSHRERPMPIMQSSFTYESNKTISKIHIFYPLFQNIDWKKHMISYNLLRITNKYKEKY